MEENQIKISIIVPIYNVEKYLERCINSIINQNFKDYELILVNDGSTDDCRIICDRYKEMDNRIKVIHKMNGGLSSARNAGLDIAKGEYVAFIDSDDYIHQDMYKIMYQQAITNNSDIVVCSFKKVFETDIPFIEDMIFTKQSINYTNIEALTKLCNNRLDYVVTWNKIYKRYIFEYERFEIGRIHEDEFIMHRLLYKSNQITYIPQVLYYYFQRTGSIMNSDFNIKRLDKIEALEDRIMFLDNLGLTSLRECVEYYFVSYCLKYYFILENNNIYRAECRNLKNKFIKKFKNLFMNNKFSKKEKLLWIIFIINPHLYKYYILIRNRVPKTRT